jgi:iron complex outermembrane receptor protein
VFKSRRPAGLGAQPLKVAMPSQFRAALLGSVSILAAAAPGLVQAQDNPDETAVSEIVVTGTRIRRADSFDAPIPISMIDGDVIRQSGYGSLAESLVDLPRFAGNINQQNTGGTLYQSGQARVDLRALGQQRTLVLVDGRRHVFSDAGTPGVDLNMFPQLMVERVDVVPGGASAVYGSEAIAGVVNVIMRKSFEGFMGDVQTGVSSEGDGEEFRIGGVWGKKFADGRANVVLGGEVFRSEPIMQRDRDWAYPGLRRSATAPATILPNSRTNVSPYATFQLSTTAAVAVSAADPTRIAILSPACATPVVSQTCQDPALAYTNDYSQLQGKVSRGVFRGYADYELTDKVKLFGEVSYAKVKAYDTSFPAFSSAGSATMPIFFGADNGFLLSSNTPAYQQLRGILVAAGVPLGVAAVRAPVYKFWREFGTQDKKSDRETIRAVVGMQGEFEAAGRNVNWDWYGQYGESSGTITNYAQPHKTRLAQSVDAVLVNGQVVCRDVTARAAGCVPWDLVGGPSQAAVAWAYADSSVDQKIEQTVLAANIGADLFDLPAGPLAIAAGAEYRREESRFVQDALGAANLLYINQIGTRAGSYDVVEAYGEVRVPLLKDVPFAEELSVEFAGRLADYSSVGTTDQYRMAAAWSPVRDIRVRASQSTAVRAPNIVELYAPQSRSFLSNVVDPCDRLIFASATAAQQAARRVTCAAAIAGWNPATFNSNIGPGRASLATILGGNRGLEEEKAKTYELGVVFEPRFAPGLKVSFDFFKYNMDGLIGTTDANSVLTLLCHNATTAYADNPFCGQISRNAAGAVTEVRLINQNIQRVKVEGYDVAVAYGFELSGDHRIDLRAEATNMYRYALQSQPGQAYVNLAGQTSIGAPKWRGQFQARWTSGPVQVNWTAHYIGPMGVNPALTAAALSPYYTKDYYRHDLRASFDVNDKVNVRGGVLNLLDETPPLLPETYTGTSSAGAGLYDNRGRFFYVGATLRY